MSSAAHIHQEFFSKIIDESKDGISIIDARQASLPLIYVNKGFENLTGYTSTEVVGKSFRTLQTGDSHQSELATIRSAITKGEKCAVTLRNFRKDGSTYWSELSISPVYDNSGTLSHFISIQKDVSARILLEQQLNTLTKVDPVVGISNRRHFDERFLDLLSVAKRIHCELSVLLINMDYFKAFNERYGQQVGDECLREVGHCIARSFVRASDCAARYSGEEFAVVSFSSNLEGLQQHTLKLCERVRMLKIPHHDSPHGVVTVSIGGIQRMPNQETAKAELIDLAMLKLLAAKRSGCNCVIVVR